MAEHLGGWTLNSPFFVLEAKGEARTRYEVWNGPKGKRVASHISLAKAEEQKAELNRRFWKEQRA